jgi:hypothetical protein
MRPPRYTRKAIRSAPTLPQGSQQVENQYNHQDRAHGAHAANWTLATVASPSSAEYEKQNQDQDKWAHGSSFQACDLLPALERLSPSRRQ